MIIDKVSTKSQIKCHADQIFSKLRPKCILWLEKISNEEFLNCIEALVYKLKAYFLAWRYFNEIHTVDPLECLLCIAKIWNLKLFPVRNYIFFSRACTEWKNAHLSIRIDKVRAKINLKCYLSKILRMRRLTALLSMDKISRQTRYRAKNCDFLN